MIELRNYQVRNKREKHPSWKGGIYINDGGYVMVYNPEHLRSSSNGYVREHIILAENALGRLIPDGVQVHHYGKQNDNGKLILCEDQEYHYLLHQREKSLNECGNPNKRKCKFCKKYDDPRNLHITQQKNGHGWNIHHQSCESDYERLRTIKRRVARQNDKIKRLSS